jgi:hypothetical protein
VVTTKEYSAMDNYQIRVRGQLDKRWSEWFDGFEMRSEGDDSILHGRVPDQAALHGILSKIRDLDLTILLVEKIKRDRADEI